MAPAETDCFFGGEILAAGSTRRLPRGEEASRVEEDGGAGAAAGAASLAATSFVAADVGIVASAFLSPPSPRALTVAAGAFVIFAPSSCDGLRMIYGRRLGDEREERRASTPNFKR